MTETQLAEIEARAKGDIPYTEQWLDGLKGQRQVVMSGEDADRLLQIWRSSSALVAEVRRLRKAMGDPCLCRVDHEPGCQCWNDK